MSNLDPHLSSDAKLVIKSLGGLVNKFSKKKILITGSGGFLGTQFLYFFTLLNQQKILDKPCKIFAYDNFSRGFSNWLLPIKEQKNIFFFEKDVTNPGKYELSDYVIHAASIASPLYYRKNPIETMDANVLGLRKLLDYSLKVDLKSFLFFSTSEIYGDPDKKNIPTNEDYRGHVSCTGPRACYDESKRFGETLCVNFHNIHHVPVKIVRPFNNYGPGLKITDRRVLPDFFNNVLSDKDIVLLSDGKATRTFCYISDAIEGYIRVLLSDFDGEAFNIGADSPEISMYDLAKKVASLSEKKLNVIFSKSNDLEYLTDNPNRRCPSIEKARSLLGFTPKISIDEGLKRSFNFYIDNKKGEKN